MNPSEVRGYSQQMIPKAKSIWGANCTFDEPNINSRSDWANNSPKSSKNPTQRLPLTRPDTKTTRSTALNREMKSPQMDKQERKVGFAPLFPLFKLFYLHTSHQFFCSLVVICLSVSTWATPVSSSNHMPLTPLSSPYHLLQQTTPRSPVEGTHTTKTKCASETSASSCLSKKKKRT